MATFVTVTAAGTESLASFGFITLSYTMSGPIGSTELFLYFDKDQSASQTLKVSEAVWHKLVNLLRFSADLYENREWARVVATPERLGHQ